MTCQARSHSYTSGKHNSVSGTSRKCSRRRVNSFLSPLHSAQVDVRWSRLTNRKCSMPSVLSRGYFHRRPSERVDIDVAAKVLIYASFCHVAPSQYPQHKVE